MQSGGCESFYNGQVLHRDTNLRTELRCCEKVNLLVVLLAPEKRDSLKGFS